MSSPTTSPPPKRFKTAAPSLCKGCQLLDFDALFPACKNTFLSQDRIAPSVIYRLRQSASGLFFYADAICVHRFRHRLTLPSTCPLCRFFRSLRIQADTHQDHKLLAFRSSESRLFHGDRLRALIKAGYMSDVEDEVFMAVVPDVEELPATAYGADWLDKEVPEIGSIFHIPSPGNLGPGNRKPLLTAKERSDRIDLHEVRHLLEMCRREHGDACRRQTSRDPIEHSFKLIDCCSDVPIVEEKPWGTRYAALSYMWGSSVEDFKPWPETVLAAIEVTRKLGLRYLWVDRSCINQSDPVEKAYLISRMTMIYEAAQLTIVAAAGAGATYGIPGIRSTPRTSQRKYALDSGNLLLAMLPDPRSEILKSTYWTRGWTYQEGVLSNRRIVFTNDQFYWECRCMAADETTITPLTHVLQSSRGEDKVLADCLLGGIFRSDVFGGGNSSDQEGSLIETDSEYMVDYGFSVQNGASFRSQLRGINEHVREFSKRDLTCEKDTLPAFQGILGLYEHATSIAVFHGLPLWTGEISGGLSGVLATFALTVSSWHHHSGLERAMFISDPCHRKPHLPSWTWVGWHGVVSWRVPPNLEHCAYMSDIINATGGNILWAADLYLYNTGRSQPIRLLGQQAAGRLMKESPALMEVRNPFVLTHFERVEISPQWAWTERKGRPGRQRYGNKAIVWDTKWYRIGRRLSFIGVSVAMTPSEWTAKHVSGELVSVLLFAGRLHDSEHGTARFLTLRRAEGTLGKWERVGTLYLTLPFLGTLESSSGLFHKMPARRQERVFAVQ